MFLTFIASVSVAMGCVGAVRLRERKEGETSERRQVAPACVMGVKGSGQVKE